MLRAPGLCHLSLQILSNERCVLLPMPCSAYAYQDAGTGGKVVWVEVEDLSRIPEPQQPRRR